MAKIRPFSAVRYDPKKVALTKVVCPPYDVINRQQRKGYARISPYNMVKITLPEGKDKNDGYLKAKKELYGWMDKGVLKKDASPAIYIYLQKYKVGKRSFSRCGFFSALELEGKGKKRTTLPHERVFSKPLLDRASLMKKTRAHLSPIFGIFRDKNGSTSQALLNKVKNKRPEVDISFEGVGHKLWRVVDQDFIERLTAQIGKTKIFIADGHHRFEASIAAKNYFKSKSIDTDGSDYTLAYLVSSQDKGLTILPTYRTVKILPRNFSMEYMLKRLSGSFEIKPITANKVQDTMDEADRRGQCAFVIFYQNRYLYLVLKDKQIIRRIGPKGSSYKWKSLDVSILHNLVFEKLLAIKEKVGSHRNIYYYKDPKEAVKKVKSGEQKLAAFLNPTKMKEVEEIAEAGERMPHKSTYFYPKLLTGLVIHHF